MKCTLTVSLSLNVTYYYCIHRCAILKTLKLSQIVKRSESHDTELILFILNIMLRFNFSCSTNLFFLSCLEYPQIYSKVYYGQNIHVLVHLCCCFSRQQINLSFPPCVWMPSCLLVSTSTVTRPPLCKQRRTDRTKKKKRLMQLLMSMT